METTYSFLWFFFFLVVVCRTVSWCVVFPLLPAFGSFYEQELCDFIGNCMEYSSIPNPNTEASSHTFQILTITASYYEKYSWLLVWAHTAGTGHFSEITHKPRRMLTPIAWTQWEREKTGVCSFSSAQGKFPCLLCFLVRAIERHCSNKRTITPSFGFALSVMKRAICMFSPWCPVHWQ